MAQKKETAKKASTAKRKEEKALETVTVELPEGVMLEMKELPSDEKGKREILNLAADIIVGRVVSGDNTAGQKMLEEYGIIGVKRKVALNKDFQRYLENCITNKEMTGKQLAEELTGDKVMPKVKSVKTDLEKENAQKTPKSPHIGK